MGLTPDHLFNYTLWAMSTGSITPSTSPEKFLELSHMALAKQEYQQSIDYAVQGLEKVESTSYHKPKFLQQIAMCYAKKKEYDMALEAIHKGLQCPNITDKTKGCLNGLGAHEYFRLKNYDESRKMAEEGLKCTDDNVVKVCRNRIKVIDSIQTPPPKRSPSGSPSNEKKLKLEVEE